MKKKVAVVGAGYYGCLVALSLSKYFNVTLIEKSNRLFSGASSINQSRLHEGYHYPRSNKTFDEIYQSNKLFKEKFGKNFYIKSENYYAISKYDSKTNVKQFEKFCNYNNLFYEEDRINLFNYKNISNVYRVNENILNNEKIADSIINEIASSNINIIFNHKFVYKDVRDYDDVILCTYGNDFDITQSIDKKYRFQVVEKIKIKLPENFRYKSVVVMDGPFFCFDPTNEKDIFRIGHVKYASHAENIGYRCNIPEYLRNYINKNAVSCKSISNFENIIKHASEFIPGLVESEYINSQFVVRCVLSNIESTDERLTLITKIDDKIYSINSGKINSAFNAAQKIVNILVD